jgi:hypothetical protein
MAVLVTGAIVALLILFFWAALLATLADLTNSDAAGRGLAQAFAAFEIILVWLLLALLLVLAGRKGTLPVGTGPVASLLLPLSCAASLLALGLLTEPHVPPYMWPIVAPALVPPAIVAFCTWAVLPPALRLVVPADTATGATWAIVLFTSLAIVPMYFIHPQ